MLVVGIYIYHSNKSLEFVSLRTIQYHIYISIYIQHFTNKHDLHLNIKINLSSHKLIL